MLILVFACIGGKVIFALSQRNVSDKTFLSMLGGFVFWGGFFGGAIGLYLYSYIYKKCFLDLADVYLSVLPLGQAIGRIGCYFNGCCYGIEYNGIFSVRYIVNGRYINVFPTWFVESFFCFGLFIYFFLISKRKIRGYYTSLYLIVYSFFRFFLEYYRGDTIRGHIGVLSTSQCISIISFVCGIVIMVYANCVKKNNFMIKGR